MFLLTHAEIKSENKKRALESALKLFYKNGIAKTTISDVAKKARLSNTPIYQYFKDKDTLVLNVAELFSNNLYNEVKEFLKGTEFEKENGLNQFNIITNYLIQIAEKDRRFVLFNYELSNYIYNIIVKRKYKDTNSLVTNKLGEMVISSIEKGIEDKSIRDDIPARELFGFLSSAMLGSMERAINQYYVHTDEGSVFPLNTAQRIKELIVYYIQNKQEK